MKWIIDEEKFKRRLSHYDMEGYFSALTSEAQIITDEEVRRHCKTRCYYVVDMYGESIIKRQCNKCDLFKKLKGEE